VEQAYAEKLGLTLEQAGALLAGCPELRGLPADAAAAQLASLAFLLGRTAPAAAAVALKAPALLLWSAPRLHDRVAELAGALALPQAAALALAYIAPHVLTDAGCEPGLSACLDHAARALGCAGGRAGLAPLLAKAPRLALLPPAELDARLAALHALLGLPAAHVVDMCRASPGLLTQGLPTLASKVEGLAQALDMRPSEVAQVAACAPLVFERSLAATQAHVAALLAVFSRAQLRSIALREPAVVGRSSAAVLRNVQALAALLPSLSRGALVQLLLQRPSLLTRSDATLGRAFRALSIWHLDAAYKTELIAAHPSLLRLSPREVHGRCAWLRRLMEADGYAHATLRRLPPELVGVALLHLPAAWPRLAFMSEARRHGALPFMAVVQASAADFAAALPEYPAWVSGRDMTPPWRRPGGVDGPREGAEGGGGTAATTAGGRSAAAGGGGGRPAAGGRPRPQQASGERVRSMGPACPLPRAPAAAGGAAAKGDWLEPESSVVAVGGSRVRKPRRPRRLVLADISPLASGEALSSLDDSGGGGGAGSGGGVTGEAVAAAADKAAAGKKRVQKTRGSAPRRSGGGSGGGKGGAAGGGAAAGGKPAAARSKKAAAAAPPRKKAEAAAAS